MQPPRDQQWKIATSLGTNLATTKTAVPIPAIDAQP